MKIYRELAKIIKLLKSVSRSNNIFLKKGINSHDLSFYVYFTNQA